MIFDKHFNETSTSLLLDVKEGQVPGATPLHKHKHTLMSLDDTHTPHSSPNQNYPARTRARLTLFDQWVALSPDASAGKFHQSGADIPQMPSLVPWQVRPSPQNRSQDNIHTCAGASPRLCPLLSLSGHFVWPDDDSLNTCPAATFVYSWL